MNTQSISEFFKKQPLLSAAALLSLAIVGFTYYRYTGQSDLETLLATKTSEGQRVENNISAGKLLNEQLVAVTAANAQTDSRLVSSADLATNLGYFYKMEADTGVKLLDLRQIGPAKGAAKGAYLPVAYTVAVQGEYKKVLTFLRKVETGEHFSRILTASFSTRSGEAAESSTVTLNLSLELLGKS